MKEIEELLAELDALDDDAKRITVINLLLTIGSLSRQNAAIAEELTKLKLEKKGYRAQT